MKLLANWYAQGGGSDDDEEEGAEGGQGKGTNGGAALSAEELESAARRKKELPLSKCNAFLRRALFEEVQARYPELLAEARNGQVVVLRLTEAEKRAREEQRERDRQARLYTAVGARHVFKVGAEEGVAGWRGGGVAGMGMEEVLVW